MQEKREAREKRTFSSWDEWFEAIGATERRVSEYERELSAWYACFETDPDRFQQAFSGHHDDGFYRTEGVDFLPKGQLAPMGRIVAKGIAAGFIAVFIAMLVMTHAADVNACVTASVVGGVLTGIFAGAVRLGVMRANMQRHASKLDAIADEIRPVLTTLPPKYRNSAVMDYIYQTYLNYNEVITYDQACDCVQNWIQSMGRDDANYIAKTFAVLFDVPFEGAGPAVEQIEVSRTGYEVDMASDVMKNEYLPADIVGKTFRGADDPEKALSGLIGLTGVKRQVSQMRNRMQFYSQGGKRARVGGNHMCFLGSPGTGKTTVARILTRFLYDFGYISENKCVEVDGAYFKSPYVGQTGYRTGAILDYAMGGVLFIDEAYLMLDDNSAGTEATGTLLKVMEDRRDDFVVIFAGYEDAVNRLLASNEGFASRIKHKVYFEDFTLDELMAIFDIMLAKNAGTTSYSIEPDARRMLAAHLDRERNSPTFGNARTVRTAFDKLLDAHADNYMNHCIPADDRCTITAKDVQDYVGARASELAEDTRNYMAANGIDSSIISVSELKGRTHEGSVDPDADMAALVGLSAVKDEMARMRAQFEFYDGKMDTDGGYHMCFVGAPGTGKTTVAGIMTGYLYKLGIIQRNEYIDVNGDFLRGSYLGHTGKRTQATVQYAQGGVLFIDEAYLLQQSENGDAFGQEAIGVLIDAMEKHRRDFVVIVAGYDREMQVFLDANSGMRSRISRVFRFENYSVAELSKILQAYAKADGFRIERDAWAPIQRHMRDAQLEAGEHFGNARFVRSYWGEIKQAHIMAFSQGEYDEGRRWIISARDAS